MIITTMFVFAQKYEVRKLKDTKQQMSKISYISIFFCLHSLNINNTRIGTPKFVSKHFVIKQWAASWEK